MVSESDLSILRFGQAPNVIITDDVATISSAFRDCAQCNGWQLAHHIAYAPSVSDDGYRVVAVCVACANGLVRNGQAIDRRTERSAIRR